MKTQTTLLAMLLSLTFTSVANANEYCADLFEPRYEGRLNNPGAKALMVSKVQNILPAGVYQVRMTSEQTAPSTQTLGISYSGTNGSMLVRLGSTYLLAGNPLSPGTMIQLLPNQNIVISGQVRIGEHQSYNGQSTRDARIEFSTKPDGTVVLAVSEATTNRSVYRKTDSTFQTKFILEIVR